MLFTWLGECCYWYRRFPATPSACYGTTQTATVSLVCEVQYWPLNNSNDIEVKWFKSRSEESAGKEGELLIDENKYREFGLTSVNQSFIRYILGILNFNSSDRGYYWCQISVNNVSLSPSPYGHIYSSQCSFLDTICNIDQLLCAQNLSLRFMAHRQVNGSNCSLVANSYPLEGFSASSSRTIESEQDGNTVTGSIILLAIKTSENMDIVSTLIATMSPTVNVERMGCDLSSSGYLCAAGIISGLFILILSLIAVVLCILIFRKNKRNEGTKSKLQYIIIIIISILQQ